MTRILTSAGNPAAVCLLSDDIADELKQQIATEMNLSETAFVIPRERFETMIAHCTEYISCIYVKCYLVCLSTKGEGDPFATGSRFGLRWFTPTTEVPLCGHANLASASVLFYKRGNQQATLRLNPFHSHSRKNLSLLQKLHFETVHSGVLTATRVGSMIEMELPLNPPDTGNYHNAPRGPSFPSPSLYLSVSQAVRHHRQRKERERETDSQRERRSDLY